MGIAPPALLEIVAVIARRRHTQPVDGEDSLRHLLIVPRLFQGDMPRRAVKFLARRLEFARGFGEVIMDPHGLEPGRDAVDRVPRRDAVEVDFDGRVLAQPIALDAQVLMTDPRSRARQRLDGRDFFASGLGTEAPEIEQRLHREIERAVALH
ncbi:hypothetical protein D3C73_939970 [compost metagenome]